MSNDAASYRQRAQDQRREARDATLPNVRSRALHAAERWDLMAGQAERYSPALSQREAEKAVRNFERQADGSSTALPATG